MAGRLRSSVPLLRRMISAAGPLPGQRSAAYRPLHCLAASSSEVPIAFFAGTGKYASALFISAVKANALDKVQSDLTSLLVLSENMRLKHLDTISEKFTELSMAHKGEVKAIITSVIPLPTEEEKELRETLQDVIGQGKKVLIEQKFDPNVIGGLVVQFDQKVFDMSIRTRAMQMESWEK